MYVRWVLPLEASSRWRLRGVGVERKRQDASRERKRLALESLQYAYRLNKSIGFQRMVLLFEKALGQPVC